MGKILEDWRVGKLGDFIELKYGKGLPERKREAGNIPVFGSNGIVGFHNKSLIKGPGIIIGRKGSIGKVVFSKEDFFPIDTTYYVDSKLPLKFIYYLLKTLNLEKLDSSSAVPGLNRNDAYSLLVNIPNREAEQRAIASILGALDDKIELNRQMNATLEAIGQAVFTLVRRL